MAFVSQDAGRGWPSARRRRRADANQTQPQMYQDGPTLLFAPDGTSAARYVYIEYPAVEPNGFRQYQQQVAYHDPQAFPPPAADVPHDINPATGLRNAATLDQHILQCLCIQSDRCKHVVKRLCKLQKFVSRLDMACFGATIHELKSTRRLLLQLADYFELFPLRLHFVLFYVNATLGSLRCSIDLMTSLLSERSLLPRSRWPHLIKVFTHETGGAYMPPLRFHMYNDFLTKLASFLSGANLPDPRASQDLFNAILLLRHYQQIGGPSQIEHCPELSFIELTHYHAPYVPHHWAETIFTGSLPSETHIRRRVQSKSFGPNHPSGHLVKPDLPHILFRRLFDNNISMTVYLDPEDNCAHLILRTINNMEPWFAMAPLERIIITRSRGCVSLHVWSPQRESLKPLASLNFDKWEELILFYCTFLSLKMRHSFDGNIRHDEDFSKHENILFRVRASEGGVTHHLALFEDKITNCLRLQSTILEGRFPGCPAWTIFLTNQPSGGAWFQCVSQNRIRLFGVQVFSFSNAYRPIEEQYGRTRDHDVFFINSHALKVFCDFFPDMVLP